MLSKCLLFLLLHFSFAYCRNCLDLDIAVSQKVENEGFHRNVYWLIEVIYPNISVVDQHNCTFVLRLDVNEGMYVNPDQIADYIRLNKISAYIDGEVNIETITHESEPHIVYVFLNTSSKMSVDLPLHLRYQRAQITGGYSKVVLPRPSLLLKCEGISLCGKYGRLQGPCNSSVESSCYYANYSYQALFEEAEMYVPIGDLDDYPIVSVVTLLLGCAGCIYVLSVLSMTPL